MFEKFVKFDKIEKEHYQSLLEKFGYDGVGGVCKHIMKLVHYYIQLKAMKMNLENSYLI